MEVGVEKWEICDIISLIKPIVLLVVRSEQEARL